VDLSTLDWNAMDMITSMEPFGYGNRTPLFVSRGVTVLDSRVVGLSRPPAAGDRRAGSERAVSSGHLKLKLQHRDKTWDAIAFRQGDWVSHLPRRIDIAYTLETNTWNGQTTLQLNVRDIQPSKTA
jgi:single-stranded-DNA-specific exonuclease